MRYPCEHVAFMQAASAEVAYLRNNLDYFEDNHPKFEYLNVTQRPKAGLHLPETGRLHRAGEAKTKRGKSLLPRALADRSKRSRQEKLSRRHLGRSEALRRCGWMDIIIDCNKTQPCSVNDM